MEISNATDAETQKGGQVADDVSTKESTTDFAKATGNNSSSASSGFSFVPAALTLKSFESKEAKALLQKWNMDTHYTAASFRFNKRFSEDDVDQFLGAFFNDTCVRSSVKVATSRTMTHILGEAKSLTWKRMKTNVTNMSFFDRLRDEGLVTASGSIRKCMEEIYDGVTSGDLVREMLLNEDSEHFFIYDDDEREELLFHVFKSLAIGGSMCQWEDAIAPYEKMAKNVYRDLLTVHKSKSTGKIECSTVVIRVLDADGFSLFPHTSDHNICYLAIDSLKSTVTIWYHAFVPYW